MELNLFGKAANKTQMEVIFSMLINAQAGVSDVWINEKIEFMLARIVKNLANTFVSCRYERERGMFFAPFSTALIFRLFCCFC